MICRPAAADGGHHEVVEIADRRLDAAAHVEAQPVTDRLRRPDERVDHVVDVDVVAGRATVAVDRPPAGPRAAPTRRWRRPPPPRAGPAGGRTRCPAREPWCAGRRAGGTRRGTPRQRSWTRRRASAGRPEWTRPREDVGRRRRSTRRTTRRPILRLPARCAASRTATVPRTLRRASPTGSATLCRTSIWAARWKTTSGRAETISGPVPGALTSASSRSKRGSPSARARFAARPVDRSSTPSTSFPSRSRRSTRVDPMKPAAPVTTVRTLSPSARVLDVQDRGPGPVERLRRRGCPCPG